MLVEGVVLRGHEGLGHVGRQVLQADQIATLVVELADHAPLAVEHAAGQERAVVGQVAQVRQAAQEEDVERRQAGDPRRHGEAGEDDQDARGTGAESHPGTCHPGTWGPGTWDVSGGG